MSNDIAVTVKTRGLAHFCFGFHFLNIQKIVKMKINVYNGPQRMSDLKNPSLKQSDSNSKTRDNTQNKLIENDIAANEIITLGTVIILVNNEIINFAISII
jgi:hypothetical protein